MHHWIYTCARPAHPAAAITSICIRATRRTEHARCGRAEFCAGRRALQKFHLASLARRSLGVLITSAVRECIICIEESGMNETQRMMGKYAAVVGGVQNINIYSTFTRDEARHKTFGGILRACYTNCVDFRSRQSRVWNETRSGVLYRRASPSPR